jgi:hypothetical protein
MSPVDWDYGKGVCYVVADRSPVNITVVKVRYEEALVPGAPPQQEVDDPGAVRSQRWVPGYKYQQLCIEFTQIFSGHVKTFRVNITDQAGNTVQTYAQIQDTYVLDWFEYAEMETCMIPFVGGAAAIVKAVAHGELRGVLSGAAEIEMDYVELYIAGARVADKIFSVVAAGVSCGFTWAEIYAKTESDSQRATLEVTPNDLSTDTFVGHPPEVYGGILIQIQDAGWARPATVTLGSQERRYVRGEGYGYLSAKFGVGGRTADRIAEAAEMWHDRLQEVITFGVWDTEGATVGLEPYRTVTHTINGKTWTVWIHRGVIIDVDIQPA